MLSKLSVNVLGGIGYIASIFGWLWAIVIIFSATKFMEIITPEPVENVEPVRMLPNLDISAGASEVIGFIALIVILGITALVVIRLPIIAPRVVSRATKKTANTVVKAVISDKKIEESKRLKLSYRVVNLLKLAIVILPPVVVVFATIWPDQTLDIGSELAIFVASAISTVSLSFFLAQYLLATALNVDQDKII